MQYKKLFWKQPWIAIYQKCLKFLSPGVSIEVNIALAPNDDIIHCGRLVAVFDKQDILVTAESFLNIGNIMINSWDFPRSCG